MDVDLSPDADLSSSYLSGIKLNRGPWPVAQDHTNLDCNPEHFQTVAQVAIEILNISCAELVA